MTPILPLFFIIFLEGYIVLSTELLAIRILVPFTGSGTDTVSIIIASVLLPLAFGYYAGGIFKRRHKKKTVRGKLVSNLAISACILTVGLSYLFLNWAFVSFQEATGIYNRIVLTAVYALLFVVYPVFLLGQTVPLVSNYFSKEKMSYMAGRILFFSTLGSFMGAVFCTLVLMNTIGVHNTVTITIGCMTLLVLVLARKKSSTPVSVTAACLAAAIALNSPAAMDYLKIVGNNMYSTVQIIDRDEEGARHFMLNRQNASSIFQHSTETYQPYAIFIEDNFIVPVMEEGPKRSILVLGAAGFIIGQRDEKNDYTFVDIDPQLKKIAEKDFLKRPLQPNKTFVPMDARAFLIQSKDKYDLIVLDLFRDAMSMPENLVTREFFQLVKDHIKDGGFMVGNYWGAPVMTDPYSRNIDHTLHSVFPGLTRQIIGDFNPWEPKNNWRNTIYSAANIQGAPAPKAYTDDKNSVALDLPAEMPH